MNYLNERVSYLRGLTEGLGINEQTNEGKILVNIIDILDDIVETVSELETSQAELDEYVETIDEDLSDIEDQLYGEDEFEDYEDEPHYIEIECPHCHETVFFDEDIFDDDDEIACPNCRHTIYEEEKE